MSNVSKAMHADVRKARASREATKREASKTNPSKNPEKAAVMTTSKPNVERIEQNGVKRPGPGKCLEVWEWLDENGNCMPKRIREVAAEKGWNENNAQIELYQWRKFTGQAGRQTTPV